MATAAERQKAYRARRRNGVTPETVTVPVTLRVPRNAETVTALRARVTELEEEVGRLKRDLATANAKVRALEARPVPAPVVVSAPLAVAEQAVRRIEAGHRSPIKSSAMSPRAPKAMDFGCAGPGRCRKLACAHA